MNSELGPPGVFDFHARLAPRPGALAQLLAVMDSCGIRRAGIAAGGTIDPVRLSQQLVDGGRIEADADNDAVRVAAEGSGGRLVPFYFANPHRPAADYADAATGFRGLEISPAVHGVPLTDRRVVELVEFAGSVGHSVYVVCLPRPGATVGDLIRLASGHPRTTFVLGHSGVGNIDYYGIELVRPVPNIMVETSGGYTTVLRAALDRLGPDRLLFGSEHPLQHPAVELAKYHVLDLPAAHWRQIAWTNAHRVLLQETA